MVYSKIAKMNTFLVILQFSVFKEWIKMKVAGGKCEALELNAEDRRRIEEIKRELLLHTKHTKVRHNPPEEVKHVFF